MQIAVFDSPESLAAGAGELFFELAHESIRQRGRFDALLSGGSTPRAVYQWLAAHADVLDWARVRLFFGDERCVPPDHIDSNYRMAREAMIDSLDGYGVAVFRVHTELPPDEAAAQYQKTLEAQFTGLPAFDLAFLGLGTDTHTASLFPGTRAIHQKEAWFVAQYVEAAGAWRTTATPPLLNNARVAAFLVSGASKAEPVEKVLFGERDVDRYPAQVIAPASGDLRWLLDREAARLIEGKGKRSD